MKRIFVAIPVVTGAEFPDAFRKLRSRLNLEAIKWVEEQNLHLTLKFLGDSDDETIDRIKSVLSVVAARYSPFKFSLNGFGFFGNKRQPTVIYAGIKEQSAFIQLADDIDKSVTGLGFEPESRKFRAHLTVGRIKYLSSFEKFSGILKAYEGNFFGMVTVDRIILFESILTRVGPVYKSLFQVML